MLLQSQFGWEILRINIYMEQYLIAYTEETLLLGNLDNCKLSEIMWNASGHEKFLVDNPSICLIHNNGELFLVEYGCNDLLTTVQTDLFQEALIRIRLDCKFSSTQPSEHGNNRLAYLVDLQTVQVKDIVSGNIIDTINHTYEIVWLQLNPRASHLLLCDKRRQLHLFELGNHGCITLLDICNFVQWVPDTDVVIAQSHLTLYIWYSIQNIQHATKFSLKGDLEGVRRVQGHTEVLVYEGFNTVAYDLDEALINVGLALEKHELDQAFFALDPLELTVETQFMWKQLAEKSLQQKKLLCAQKSFASCGDISRSVYLHKVYKKVQPNVTEMEDDGKGHSFVQIKLAALLQSWEDAEKSLLEQGHTEDAIKMYTDNYRWKEAFSVSKAQDFSNGEKLSRLYLQWLLKTGQIEEAGKEIASSGEIAAAVNVSLMSNLLGLAADYALKLPSNLCEGILLDRITDELTRSGMLVKLGEFMESLGNFDKAQHAYQKGHFFHHALKLAEKNFKSDVPKVEEDWGDWMVSRNEMEAAISHYLEAGCFLKAIESAVASHQWTKATQIADQQNNEVVKPIYARLAQYFAKIKQFEEAQRLFICAELPGEALSMYLKANKYEAAEKVASQLLSPDEACLIYLREAKEHEVSRHFKDAEKLYLEAGQHDFAINMYKTEGMFDKVIQLVAKFKKDGLHETHLYVAQELERKGMLRDAEHHYLEVHEWKSTVKMYSTSDMWEDALRIAKSWGGPSATKQVAYAWAISVNGSNGLQSLAKLGLINEAIDYAVDVGAFSNAFQLCEAASTDKQQEVQIKFAKFLEDQGRFQESEDILIKVGKPMEAVNMYVQQKDWKAALRVADFFQPLAVADVQVFQGQALVENNELRKAETLFVQAKKPELAIEMYKARNLWEEAIRVAQKFMPAGLSEIQNNFAAFVQSKSGGGDALEFVLAKAKAAESSQDFQKAIDLYVEMDLKSLPDMERLRKVWHKALELTKEHAKNRLSEVMHAIAEQLIRAGQYQEAAQLYLEYDEYKEAVDVYILGGHWNEARKVADGLGHQNISEHIESMYKKHLLKTGEAGLLVGIGSVQEALPIYSSGEDWDKVHELSASMGPEAQKDCSVRHAAHCLQNFKVFEAISVLSRYGLPTTAESSELCGGITSQLFYSCSDTPVSVLAMQEFRSLLYNHVQKIKGSTSPDSQAEVEYLEGMLAPITYMVLCFACHQQGLKVLATKLSVSLLRFIPSLPADKAFYEAGMASKEKQ